MITIDVSKKLSHFSLNLSLHVEEGEFVAIRGKSGSGKTTLLRIIAGLEEAQGGIKVHNKLWQSKQTFLPPQKRDIGFVFQDYALFENMNVLENLLFVAKDKELAYHLLETTQMLPFQNSYPKMLSGGQKQRVSIARALMKKPKILLMDEPLSALDVEMRSKLQEEILLLHKEFGTTTLMVSHSPNEIYKLSNRVITLEEGKIISDTTPKEALLKTSGSQKFSFEGEVLDIYKVDVIYVAIISIYEQIVEVVLSDNEIETLSIGERVSIGAKAFAPIIQPKKKE
jgi:molybdate transport system ATP-binding protein